MKSMFLHFLCVCRFISSFPSGPGDLPFTRHQHVPTVAEKKEYLLPALLPPPPSNDGKSDDDDKKPSPKCHQVIMRFYEIIKLTNFRDIGMA